MVQITMNVDTSEVRAGLARIKRKLHGRIIRQSTQAGAGVIKRALIAAAPVDTGSLKKAITVVVRYRGKMAVAGMDAGKKFTFKRTKKGRWRIVGKKTSVSSSDRLKKRWPAKYAHLTEGGRQSSRPYAGTKWMSRTFRRVQHAASAKMVAKMKQMIEET